MRASTQSAIHLQNRIVSLKAPWHGAGAGGGDVESQYAGEYEDRVNPFREFIAGERSLRRRQLSAPDRIMYELGHVVSSSRCARDAPV